MATPAPIRTPQPQVQVQAQPQSQQQPLHHIKSAARKLPIKRKPSSPPLTSSPNPSSSNPTTIAPTGALTNPQTFSIIVDDGDDGGNLAVLAVPNANDAVDDYYDAESDGADSDHSHASAAAASAMGAPAVMGGGGTAVPFKFHRIWSEVDEIRFLEGLLECHAEGLVFPRDLNLFFDRFRGTMTTPYSRSQLSEKLRRLRKKFRIASSRIARGLSPAAMSPHDRGLYDLSAQLWHPSFAEGSPFAPPGTDLPKRRRRVPTSLEEHQQLSNSGSSNNYNYYGDYDHHDSHILPQQQSHYRESAPVNPTPAPFCVPTILPPQPSSLPSPLPLPPPPPSTAAAALPTLENGPSEMGTAQKRAFTLLTPPKPEPFTDATALAPESPPASGLSEGEFVGEPDQGLLKQNVVKAVLDVFDDAVKDVQLLLPPVAPSHSGWTEQLVLVDQGSRLLFRRAEFAKKWQEQRAAELNAVAGRLRLVIERTIQG